MPTTTFFNSIYPQFPFENRKSEINGREDGRDMAREGCGAVRLMEIINQSRNIIIYEDAWIWISVCGLWNKEAEFGARPFFVSLL